MKLYFIHYSCVVIILFNTDLYTTNAQISVSSRISAPPRPPFNLNFIYKRPRGGYLNIKPELKGMGGGGGVFEYLKTSI